MYLVSPVLWMAPIKMEALCLSASYFTHASDAKLYDNTSISEDEFEEQVDFNSLPEIYARFNALKVLKHENLAQYIALQPLTQGKFVIISESYCHDLQALFQAKE